MSSNIIAVEDSNLTDVMLPRRGGLFKAMHPVCGKLVPQLRSAGFSQTEIDRLLIDNPARATALKIRKPAD